MSSNDDFQRKLERFNAIFYPPTQARSRADEEIRALLPQRHRQLISNTSGISVYQGAYRLFGDSSSPAGPGLGEWNDRENWRFAWADRVDGYVLFGESAWGDQYAYRWNGDALEPNVYLLEMVSMDAEPVAASFDAFFVDEFLRNADKPYDVATVQAISALGPINFDQHWTYSPSLALGGTESLDNVVVLPAATAMRFAGDIFTGLLNDEDPTSIVTWVDVRGRQRLRLEYHD